MVFGTEAQETEKKELYEKIIIYEEKITSLRQKIHEINDIIEKNCVMNNRIHDFEREIEIGPYGGSYWVCKKCGYEK